MRVGPQPYGQRGTYLGASDYVDLVKLGMPELTAVNAVPEEPRAKDALDGAVIYKPCVKAGGM